VTNGNDPTVEITFRRTPVFDLDCALYGISDKDLELLYKNLATDPHLGTTDDGVNFEYSFNSHAVSYVMYMDRQGLILLMRGLRPPADIPKSKGILAKLGMAVTWAAKIKGLLM